MRKKLLSTAEAARLLGISRVAVFKKIKKGEINATRVGRNFVIEKDELPNVLGTLLTERTRHEIDASVEKTVKEYGEALKLLGRE